LPSGHYPVDEAPAETKAALSASFVGAGARRQLCVTGRLQCREFLTPSQSPQLGPLAKIAAFEPAQGGALAPFAEFC
jgi:hypothetical protein